ncbi:MAG: tetratricopeptide repeat protein [Desulfobacteraceae bacterium]|nr:tetratricopeptide repeat protein [Desulfobacteraceae bacterium]
MKAFIYMMLTLLLVGICITGCSNDSGQTVEAMNAEALKLVQVGQKDQALEKAKAAVEKSEKENGIDHPNSAMSLETLGLVYQSMGDADRAQSFLLRALSIVKKSYGPNSGQAAKIMNNLAGLYYAQNQNILAASFFKQSLAILEKLLPADDSRLETLHKNIDVCESMQSGGATDEPEGEGKTGPVGEDSANASQTDPSVKTPPVNMVQDLVPQQIKDSMLSQLAQQNIFISDLDPRPPVRVDNKGIVFPYHALKKSKDSDAVQEIVVLFAAIPNPEKPKAFVFQQCRLISHTSYMSALEKGGSAQLKQELQDVFPSLYL